MTRYRPVLTNSKQVCEPMYPVPPVTRTVRSDTSLSLFLLLLLSLLLPPRVANSTVAVEAAVEDVHGDENIVLTPIIRRRVTDFVCRMSSWNEGGRNR